MMGIRLAAVTESEAVAAIVEAAVAERGHWTITANLDHLRRYRCEPLVKELFADADMIVADGTPLVWASMVAGTPLPERVAGSTMIWALSEAASRRGASIFLLGGNPGVADRAAQILTERFDGLEIAGTLCPPLGFERDEEEIRQIERRIEETKPQIVLVALGFPKQDLLIRRLRRVAPHVSFMGVGIGLSFVAGDVARAPDWTHKLGMEWLYRLAHEPRRLVRRYVIQGMPFALRLMGSAALRRLRARSEAHWQPTHLEVDEPAHDTPATRYASARAGRSRSCSPR